MKKLSTLLFLVLLYTTAFSQVWQQLDSLTAPRNRAGSFAIGGKGYVVAGGSSWYLQDAWAYDTLSNTWSQIADYPSDDDDGVVGFAINGIGYLGTGAYCCYQYGNEFYSYDPGTNAWTQLPNFPGQGRSFAVAFELDGKGYIGGGLNGYNNNPLNDFYCYDPVANTWTQIANCPASGVSLRAVAFTIGDKAYVGTGGQQQGGGSSTFAPTKDFWEYDTTSKAWTQVADFGGGVRWLAVGFATCDKGYAGTGVSDENQSVFTNDMWQYDPVKNTWTQIANFGGSPRESTSAFVMGNKAYVTCGYDGNGVDGGTWRFTETVTPGFSAATTSCTGSPVTFTDTSSFGPSAWSWQFPGGTPDTSTKQNPTITYNTPGNYNIIFSAWNGCDSATTTFTNYITVTPGPSVAVSPDSPSVCKGEHINLTASGGSSYKWVGTTDTSSILSMHPSNDTTYQLKVSIGGCTTDTFISVKINAAPPLNIQPPSPQAICSGQNITFTVPSSGSGYIWSPSATLSSSTGDSVVAAPTVETTYTVAGIDSLGCAASTTEDVSIIAAPDKPVITQNGDILTSSATQGNQWEVNDIIINGATDQNYKAVIVGWYTVTTSNPANGCSSTSDSIYIAPSGINQLTIESGQVTVYPNPTNSFINLNISSSVIGVGEWSLRATDVLGRTVYFKQSLNYTNEIDLPSADGVYFICVMNKAGRVVMPVVKQ